MAKPIEQAREYEAVQKASEEKRAPYCTRLDKMDEGYKCLGMNWGGVFDDFCTKSDQCICPRDELARRANEEFERSLDDFHRNSILEWCDY